jgi:hypothetical protein
LAHAEPEAELNCNDLCMLFRAGVDSASCEAGVRFLPEAFAYRWRSPWTDEVDCLAEEDPTGLVALTKPVRFASF